jgi:hypothetical protein
VGFVVEKLALRHICLVSSVSPTSIIPPWLSILIQGDSEIGGNILWSCSTNENKAKAPYEYWS